MAVGDLFLVKIQGLLFQQVTINTFHYETTIQGPPGAEAALLRQQFDAMVSPAFRACCSSDFIHQTTSAQLIRPLPAKEAQIQTININGTRAALSCPAQVAAIITRRTGLAGRSHRGRLYVPAIPEVDHTDGTITTSYLTSLNALGAAMIPRLALSGMEWKPVIWSRFLNKQPRDARFEIVATTQRTLVRTQRRRAVGVGV